MIAIKDYLVTKSVSIKKCINKNVCFGNNKKTFLKVFSQEINSQNICLSLAEKIHFWAKKISTTEFATSLSLI